jgi:hypothetical protein
VIYALDKRTIPNIKARIEIIIELARTCHTIRRRVGQSASTFTIHCGRWKTHDLSGRKALPQNHPDTASNTTGTANKNTARRPPTNGAAGRRPADPIVVREGAGALKERPTHRRGLSALTPLPRGRPAVRPPRFGQLGWLSESGAVLVHSQSATTARGPCAFRRPASSLQPRRRLEDQESTRSRSYPRRLRALPTPHACSRRRADASMPGDR